MIDHLSTYAINYTKTKTFYDAAFGALGHPITREFVFQEDPDFPNRHCCAYGPDDRAAFWLIEAKEKYTPRHTAFKANSRAEVDAFYKAALSAGGKDNGPPGLRPIYHEDYYGAFVIDPDGNNVEAVCRLPE